MHVRVCPRCKSEFQPHVTVCIDCGGPTEERFESEDLAAVLPEPEPDWDEIEKDEDDPEAERAPAIPLDAEVVPVRAAAFGWIDDLGAALAEAGIPVRIQEGRNGQFLLSVRAEDAQAAAAVDRELYVSSLSDEAPPLPGDAAHCPACGAAIPESSDECPDCGLVVGGSEEAEVGEDHGDES